MTYILIVEDDIDNADILMHYLAPLELPVEHLTQGYDVMQIVKNNPPCLIFMDINLPDNDGRVICSQIKERLGDQAPPIIVMTAAYSGAQSIVARRMGADDFVRKPLRASSVLKKTRNVLSVAHGS